MFQKTKQMCRKALGFVNRIANKVTMFILMLLSGAVARAQNSAGDYTAGTNALSTVAEEISWSSCATPLPVSWRLWVPSRCISP